MRTKILSAEDINTVARHVGLDSLMDEVIDGFHAACVDTDGDERYEIPKRDGFNYKRPATGLVEWMPLYDRGAAAMIKMVGYHPDNPSGRQLPTIMSSMLRFDTQTGHLETIADGTLSTAVRTGAASAVASRALAKPGSTCLALIGAGAQAVTQLHALSRVFSLREVLVYDVDASVAETFLERARRLELGSTRIRLVSCAEAVQQADIVCTVTSVPVGHGPVFEDKHLKPWLHINAVGSDFPGKTEVPVSVLKRSFVCPDFMVQAVDEGECQVLDRSMLGPELAAVLREAERHPEMQQRLTVFDSTGYALEDHVVLGVLERHANALGLGNEIQLESIADPHDPYFDCASLQRLAVAPERVDRDGRTDELRVV